MLTMVVFIANAWVQYCQERTNIQLATYAGVDDHHTYGLAEIIIRYIQDNGGDIILHAQQKFPEAITSNL